LGEEYVTEVLKQWREGKKMLHLRVCNSRNYSC